MRREEGFSLVELLVVVLISGILLTITVSFLLSPKEDATGKDAQAVVSSAMDSATSYYDGDFNPHGSLTYKGFNLLDNGRLPGVRIDNSIRWESASVPHSPTLALGNQEKRLVRIFKPDSPSPPDKEIVLCSADKRYFYCGGTASNGSVRYGIDRQLSVAADYVSNVSRRCAESWGRALLRAQGSCL